MKITKECINEDGTPFSKEQFIDKIKNNKEFCDKFGELGPVYGKQWRYWSRPTIQLGTLIIQHFDQIANLIRDLKTNPDSRRLMVTAWNPADLESSVLPPCHYGFQVYTRELSLGERFDLYNQSELIHFEECTMSMLDEKNLPKRAISLIFNMRSTDVPLGLPFNIASYGLLLEIIGKMVNMVPEELIGNLGDTHIYSNQVEGCLEQIDRESYTLPKLVFGKTDEFFRELGNDLSLLSHLDPSDFKMENYQSHPTIKFPLSN